MTLIQVIGLFRLKTLQNLTLRLLLCAIKLCHLKNPLKCLHLLCALKSQGDTINEGENKKYALKCWFHF